MISGLLVVDRMWHLPHIAAVPAGRPSVLTSGSEALQKYRGFDGRAWPSREHPEFSVDNGVARIGDIDLVRGYLSNVRASSVGADLMAISRVPGAREIAGLPWKLAGFDIGYMRSEWACFSILLNEVVFGHHDECALGAAD